MSVKSRPRLTWKGGLNKPITEIEKPNLHPSIDKIKFEEKFSDQIGVLTNVEA